jgi:hypothetical protein
MRTCPLVSDDGVSLGFEIDATVFLVPLVRILERVDGVTDVRKRPLFGRWGEHRIRFRYRDAECVVLEPFGDNARYWVVPVDPEGPIDMGELERAFGLSPSFLRPWRLV